MNTCTIEIEGKEYTLCLTRDAVVNIEGMGFNIQNFLQKPVTSQGILWYGGFIAKHPEVNPNLAVKLMESYSAEGDVQEVLGFLSDEYANFLNAPTATASKSKKKKAKIVKAK